MAPCPSQAQAGRAGVPCGVRAARLTPHHMAAPVGSAYAPRRLVVPGSPLSAALESVPQPRGPWTAPRGQDEAAPHTREAVTA